MATGDIIACSIVSDAIGNGWTADITVEGVGIGGTYTWGLGSDNEPSGASVVFSVTREGYDNTGSLGTLVETVYGVPDINTGAVRQIYPNEASPDEQVSGSDVIIRVALSDHIYNDDTSITLDVAAGWYTEGGNPSTITSSFGVTNNSTLDYPKVIGGFVVPNSLVVTGDFLVEYTGFHKSGRDGNPLAAVVFTATDESANSVNTTLTDMVESSNPDDKNSVLVYAWTVPVTTLTDGDLITIECQAFPWVGDADSIMDTDDAANTFPTPLYTNLVYRLDKSDTHGKTVVDVAGNDGTGQVYSTQAAAESGNAFLTIEAAVTALQTYNNANAGHNDAGGGFVFLGEGSWTYNQHQGGGGAAVLQWVTITTKTGALKVNTFFEPAAATSYFPAFMKVSGITYTTTNSFDGINQDNIWFDDCEMNSTGTLTCANFYYGVFTNNTGMMARNLRQFGAGPSQWALVRGNSMDDYTEGPVYMCLGNEKVGISGRLAAGNVLNELCVFAFNTILGIPSVTNQITLATVNVPDNYSEGFAVVQNVFERNTSQTEPVFWISADFSTSTTYNILLWHNTLAGGRANVAYNDTAAGGPYPQLNWSERGNVWGDWNNKDDVFDSNPDGTGGWSVGYHVSFVGNVYRTTAKDAWLGEFQGIYYKSGTNLVPLDLDFVDDKSFDGDDTGNGDYHLGPSSPAIGFNLDGSPLPKDLDGTDRSGAQAYDAGAYASSAATEIIIPLQETNFSLLAFDSLVSQPLGLLQTQGELFSLSQAIGQALPLQEFEFSLLAFDSLVSQPLGLLQTQGELFSLSQAIGQALPLQEFEFSFLPFESDDDVSFDNAIIYRVTRKGYTV